MRLKEHLMVSKKHRRTVIKRITSLLKRSVKSNSRNHLLLKQPTDICFSFYRVIHVIFFCDIFAFTFDCQSATTLLPVYRFSKEIYCRANCITARKMKFLKQKVRKIGAKIITSIFLFPFPKLRRDVKRALQSGGLILDTIWRYRHGEPKNFKYYLSLLVCVRNEGKNIAEWIEYHLLQGVEHFYIYDNDSEDDTQQVLLPYVERGLVSVVFCHGRGKQIAMYRDAIKKFRDETRWLGIIDCDEFFLLKDNKKLIDYIHDYEQFSQFLVHWVLYGSSGRKERGEGLVIERFRKHADRVSSHTKAILNPRKVWAADIHYCYVIGKSCNEAKKSVHRIRDYSKETPVANSIRINHYCCKSWEEFLGKRLRSDATIPNDLNERCTDDFFRGLDHNEVTDPPELMDPYAEKIRTALGMPPRG